MLRRLDMRSFRAGAKRLAALLFVVSLVAASALSGTKFFFCASMERVHAHRTCCSDFVPSLEDVMRSETEQAAVTEDERCCSASATTTVPQGTAGAPRFEAPPATLSVSPLPAPPLVAMSGRAPQTTRIREASGPPPLLALDHCKRLSVFVL